MTLTKDESIVAQVAAKIASELAGHANSGMSEDVNVLVSDWSTAFDAVKDALFLAHGFRNETQLLQDVFPGSTYVTEPQVQAQYASSAPQPAQANAGLSIEIAGTQHGPLPDWLAPAMQRAGVRRVWDNRDKAQGTKRPWFKQADAQDGQEPAAFWPPRS